VEFQGKALTLGEEASFEFNPIDPRAIELREWFCALDRQTLKSVNAGVTSEKDQNRLHSARLVAEMNDILYSDPNYIQTIS
jgi:hypothetical protein